MELVCSHCETENAQGSNYCWQCGYTFLEECSCCGEKIEDPSNHECDNCGNLIHLGLPEFRMKEVVVSD